MIMTDPAKDVYKVYLRLVELEKRVAKIEEKIRLGAPYFFFLNNDDRETMNNIIERKVQEILDQRAVGDYRKGVRIRKYPNPGEGPMPYNPNQKSFWNWFKEILKYKLNIT